MAKNEDCHRDVWVFQLQLQTANFCLCLICVDDVCVDGPGGSGTSGAVGEGTGEFQSGSDYCQWN